MLLCLPLFLISLTVYLMAVLLRQGLFVALHHATGQGSVLACCRALPAVLLGRVTLTFTQSYQMHTFMHIATPATVTNCFDHL